MSEIRCPECGSIDVTEIVYGLICAPSPELEKSMEKGKTRLGGCCIDSDSPSHECNACFHSWQDPESELVQSLEEDE